MRIYELHSHLTLSTDRINYPTVYSGGYCGRISRNAAANAIKRARKGEHVRYDDCFQKES